MFRATKAWLMSGSLAVVFLVDSAYGRPQSGAQNNSTIQLEESLEEELGEAKKEATGSHAEVKPSSAKQHAEASGKAPDETVDPVAHEEETLNQVGHGEETSTEASPPTDLQHDNEEPETIIGKHEAQSVESSTTGLVWFGVVFIVLVSLIYLLL